MDAPLDRVDGHAMARNANPEPLATEFNFCEIFIMRNEQMS